MAYAFTGKILPITELIYLKCPLISGALSPAPFEVGYRVQGE